MNKQKIAKTNALGQIFILVVAVFAFAWLIGGFESVSAAGESCVSPSKCVDAHAADKNKDNKLTASEVNDFPCSVDGKSGRFSYGLCGTGWNACCNPRVNDGLDLTGDKITTKDKVRTTTSDFFAMKKVYDEVDGLLTDKPQKDKNILNDAKNNLGNAETVASILSTFGAKSVADLTAANLLSLSTEELSLISASEIPETVLSELATSEAGIAAEAALNHGFLGSGMSITTIAGAAAAAVGFSVLGQSLGGSPDAKNFLGGILGAGGLIGYLAIFGTLGPAAWIAAGVVFIANLFVSSTKEEGVVYYYCQPWDAKVKGEDCHFCNEQSVECSEYQCKSLGQSCDYVASDPNEDGNAFCFWNSRNDIDPPVLSLNTEALSVGYNYGNPKAVSPPDKGAWIKNTTSSDGCLSPFSQVTFGVTLDEPAKCKIDFQRQDDYEKMANYLGGSQTRKFNHTQTLVIPKMNSTVGKDNLINAYVRCQDSNGNANIHDFVFEMCIAKGPDTRAPIIYGTSIENNAKIPFNVTSANVDFFVNEPANCKWDFSDKKYEELDYNMTCATDPTQLNLRLSYTCSTNLTGIRITDPTTYYVKCQDVSPQNNTNNDYYLKSSGGYKLQSSRALSIISASPNATEIQDSTTPSTVKLEAKTAGGTYEGKALCSYSSKGIDGTYTYFENTGSSNIHSTEIQIPDGEYTYYIKCDDLGGNSDTEEIKFNVSIDVQAPLIARAYYDSNKLKIITNEKAECRYSTSSTTQCNYEFDQGVKISSVDKLNHVADWNTDEDLFIKCQDIYGNQPAQIDTCSIVLRAQNKNNL